MGLKCGEVISFFKNFMPQIMFLIFLKDFIYLFVSDTQREAETQAEREAGSTQEAPCGTLSWDSKNTPWAKDRRSIAELPRDPKSEDFKSSVTFKTVILGVPGWLSWVSWHLTSA